METTPTRLYIKNMVCDRCKLVVKQELEKLHLTPLSVELGEIELPSPFDDAAKDDLKSALEKVGFELIDDKKSKLISQVKSLIINLIHHAAQKRTHTNYSTYLAQEIGKDYTYISNLFSEVEGTTIEHYIINQKIERVKELLVYGEKNISEIATELGYSSIGHLSNQFKKITGLTPSHFKSIGINKRKPLDQV